MAIYSVAVPEPSVLALLGIAPAASLLGYAGRRLYEEHKKKRPRRSGRFQFHEAKKFGDSSDGTSVWLTQCQPTAIY